jgi:hypothetical protein
VTSSEADVEACSADETDSMSAGFVEPWDDLAGRLGGYTEVPAAQVSARLLGLYRERWHGRVVARSHWLHHLCFTLPGDMWPFDEWLTVEWYDGVYTLVLSKVPGIQIAGDKCTEANIDAVLTSFLCQLARTDPEVSEEP